MSGENQASEKIFSVPVSAAALALSLLWPGLGQAYLRSWSRSLGFALTALGWMLGGYYFAAFTAWVVPVAILGFAIFYLYSAFDAFRLGRSFNEHPNIAAPAALFALTVLVYTFGIAPNERAEFLEAPSNMMEPTLLEGDHLALDRFHNGYKPGDLVAAAAENDEHVIDIRRIQEMKSDAVVLTTDNPAHNRTEQVPLSVLRGKVMYVLYSVNPENSKPEWKRFFSKVK